MGRLTMLRRLQALESRILRPSDPDCLVGKNEGESLEDACRRLGVPENARIYGIGRDAIFTLLSQSPGINSPKWIYVDPMPEDWRLPEIRSPSPPP